MGYFGKPFSGFDLIRTGNSTKRIIISISFILLICLPFGCGGGGENIQPNNPPTANAGLDRLVNQGEEVILDGSASTDSDGRIVSFKWVQVDGPRVALTGADTVSAVYIAPTTENRSVLVFQLTVEDDGGAQDSDSVSITVNVPPIAFAGHPQAVYASTPVELNGYAIDPDGTVVSQFWEQTNGPGVSLIGEATDTARFTAPTTSGTLTFRFTVVDNNGAQQSDSVSIYISEIFFKDSFDDAVSRVNWTEVNDASPNVMDWQVVDGKYTQQNRVDKWLKSYHLGTYSYYNHGMQLSDYQVSLNIKSLSEVSGSRDSIGVMVRYQDNGNYIRFLMSRMQGFLRLETRVDGQFKTLCHSGRGINLGEDYEVLIDVRCSEPDCADVQGNNGAPFVDEFVILIYLNGEPIFSAKDIGPSNGTVALFTQNHAQFDNVIISTAPAIPKIAMRHPVAHSVALSDVEASPYALDVSALMINVPDNYGIKFAIDSGSPNEIIDFTGTFSGTFFAVPRGDRTVSAVIVDQDGDPIVDAFALDEVHHMGVGVGGMLLVAFGDSITNGVGDDWAADNDSANLKSLSRGYTPILTDLLSDHLGQAVTVYVANEGLGGTRARDGRDRVSETVNRFPESEIWLILFGTNDSSGVPSGVECQEPHNFDPASPEFDSECLSTFKGYMREIIVDLKSKDKTPILAHVPYIKNAPAARITLIAQYNQVIQNLHEFHGLPATPPDFYNHFLNNPHLFFDNIHPNGEGYKDVAQMWYNSIIEIIE